jgi:hypothetical protein
VQTKPIEGDIGAVRLTAPLKPPRAVTVMAEAPKVLVRKVTLVGLAVMVKS